MTTSKLDSERAKAWLDELWQGNKECHICGNTGWGVVPELMELREYRGGSLIPGGPIVPLFVVACVTCGNTILFNAIVAGLVEKQEDQE